MSGRGRSIVEPEKPLGLLDLWRARRSFVYRFEKRRLGARRNRFLRIAVPFLVCSAFLLLSARRLLFFFRPILWILFKSEPYCTILRQGWFVYGVTVIAAVRCARFSSSQRREGTLDALVMTPIRRNELVTSHLLAYAGVPLVMLLWFMACDHVVESIWLVWEFCHAHGTFRTQAFYAGFFAHTLAEWGALLSLALLSGVIGLQLGLWFKRVAAALPATLVVAAGLAVFHDERYWLIGRLRLGWRSYLCYPIWAFVVASVYLLAAFALLRRAARNFDAWATAD